MRNTVLIYLKSSDNVSREINTFGKFNLIGALQFLLFPAADLHIIAEFCNNMKITKRSQWELQGNQDTDTPRTDDFPADQTSAKYFLRLISMLNVLF